MQDPDGGLPLVVPCTYGPPLSVAVCAAWRAQDALLSCRPAQQLKAWLHAEGGGGAPLRLGHATDR